MKTPPTSQPRTRSRRGSVEIYFILYLSAIVLLLGTTPRKENPADIDAVLGRLLAPDFRIVAEKQALVYGTVPVGYVMDGGDSSRLERDSVNRVRVLGSVTDIRFAISSIEDSAGAAIPVESATLSTQDERTRVFTFDPSVVKSNGVYRVTIRATARPVPSPSLPADVRRRLDDRLRAGTIPDITDSVTFTIAVMSFNDLLTYERVPDPPFPSSAATPRDTTPAVATNDPQIDPLLPSMPGSPGAFAIRASPTKHNLIPGQKFESELIIQGFAEASQIEWRSTDGLKVTPTQTGTFMVAGVAPSTPGIRTYRLMAGRKGGAEMTSVPLQVQVSSPERPSSLPQTFYTENTYRPNFEEIAPSLANQMTVEVIENGRLVKKSQTSMVEYRPGADNGDVVFRVSIDDVPAGSFKVALMRLPQPTLEDVHEGDADEMIIRTTAYGKVNNKTNVARLAILDGDVQDPTEIQERRRIDEDRQVTIQYWRVRRKAPGGLSFRAYAIDQRGSGSGKSKEIEFSK